MTLSCHGYADCTFTALSFLSDNAAILTGNLIAFSPETFKYQKNALHASVVLRILSLIPYYSGPSVDEKKFHPISGSFYPYLNGFVSGYFTKLIKASTDISSTSMTIMANLAVSASLEILKMVSSKDPKNLFCSKTSSDISSAIASIGGTINSIVKLTAESVIFYAGLCSISPGPFFENRYFEDEYFEDRYSENRVKKLGLIVSLASAVIGSNWLISRSNSELISAYEVFDQGITSAPFFFGILIGNLIVNKDRIEGGKIHSFIPLFYFTSRILSSTLCSSYY